MKKFTVMGVDTGFASVGWCLVDVLKDTAIAMRMGVWTSESSARKMNIKVGDDDFARSLDMTRFFKGIISGSPTISLITCEAFSQMRNASSAVKVGRCFGTLATLSVLMPDGEVPVLHASPKEIKEATAGTSKASKEEVAHSLRQRFPEAETLMTNSDLPKGEHEHAYDALGSVIACWNAPTFVALRKILRS